MFDTVNSKASIDKHNLDLRSLHREAQDGDATLPKLRRMTSDLVHTTAMLSSKWRNFRFDDGMRAGKKLEHGLYLGSLITSWQSITGTRDQDMNPASITVFNRYYDYVCSVDDFIDESSKNSTQLNFTQDSNSRRLRKLLFSSISGITNEKEIRRLLIRSNDVMINAAMRSKNEGISDLESALRLRHETTGEFVRTELSILSTLHNVPKEVASGIERNYLHLGIALQVYDDIADFREDWHNHIAENLMFQILRQHPNELKMVDERLSNSANIKRRQFARIAPESFKVAKELQNEFFDKIPDTTDYYGIKIFARMRFGL